MIANEFKRDLPPTWRDAPALDIAEMNGGAASLVDYPSEPRAALAPLLAPALVSAEQSQRASLPRCRAGAVLRRQADECYFDVPLDSNPA